MTLVTGARRGQRGLALLALLAVLLFVTVSSTAFVWYVNRQQAQAGAAVRARRAAHLAEAGLHTVLAILESKEAPGPRWRPAAHEVRADGEGRALVWVRDGDGGALVVTSEGEVAGTTRTLETVVHLASPALLTALYGASVVRLEQPPAAMVIAPYGAGLGDRPWIHIAAGREVWFATPDVSLNDPGMPLEVPPGPIDAAPGVGPASVTRPGPVRLLLARDAALTIGAAHEQVDVHQLRTLGVAADGVVLRIENLPPLPELDRTFYRRQAAGNLANAATNAAAGRHAADGALERKRDSLYTPAEFERVQAYLAAGDGPPRLRGVIYVTGGISLLDAQRLEIADGALVAEGTVHLGAGARLEVLHTPASRTLPGLVVLDDGGLHVSSGARLRVHGLVDAARTIDVTDGGRLEVVGAVVGRDPLASVRNRGAVVVIRYDPAVLGTPGLATRGEGPVVAWIAGVRETIAPTAPPASPRR
ncbi:MAG: hypothetical protein QN174_04220 [Armatimonadota bacterium]|nr:hypothetical protein [Armatimonadota bacterium]MDR7454346.1 hypothetical protein [Armatimonadota bacterium]MDR7457308.1 hypothetical protein [Armatimonadota bacterium]MDR7496147.1 hypothetical protein [Armatimonadota bacterium]MDR7512713.1 hypothetical protein [Armatimonadota bacterium]